MNKRVEKTEAQWREQLDPMEYQVTREAATERFHGRYWDHHEAGIYTCVCCDTPLFLRMPSSIPAAAGPATSNPSIRPTCARNWTAVMACAPRSSATSATPTWATSSRRPAADRTALLHQFGFAAFRPA
jgi:hypothetical protein